MCAVSPGEIVASMFGDYSSGTLMSCAVHMMFVRPLKSEGVGIFLGDSNWW